MSIQFAFACRAVIVVVFASAVIGKTYRSANRRRFVASVRSLKLLPDGIAPMSAAIVVLAEALTAALVAVSVTATVGLALASVMLGVFVGVVIFVIATGRETRCECFGSNGSTLSSRHLARNSLLLAIAITGLVADSTRYEPNRPNLSSVVAIAAGIVVGIAVTRWDDIVFVLLDDARPSSV